MELLRLYTNHFQKELQRGSPKDGSLDGISRGAIAFFAAASCYKAQRSVVIVVSSSLEARSILEEASVFLDPKQCLFFPGYENLPYSEGGLSPETVIDRVRCLDHLLSHSEPKLIITTADAVIRKLPQAGRLYELSVSIRQDEEYAPQLLLRDLIALGYRRVDRIEGAGEVCIKGSILDVYPANGEHALRIDYFDDTIESICSFDPQSQKSRQDTITQTSILPAGEIVLNESEGKKLIAEFQQAKQDKQSIPLWASTNESNILAQIHCPNLEHFFPRVVPTVAFWNYFSSPPLVILYPALEIHEAFSRIRREFQSLYLEKKDQAFCLAPNELLCEPPSHYQGQIDCIDLNPYGGTSLGIQDTSSIRGKLGEIRRKIYELVETNHIVVLSSAYEVQLRRIAALFNGQTKIETKHCQSIHDVVKTKKKSVYLVKSPQANGFSIPNLQFYFITDAELFGRSYRRRTRAKRTESAPIESFLDLKGGSYVVHLTHGIGRFIGLEKVHAMGKDRDFLLLEYADQDRLYVPLDQISLVQQYVAPVERPRLDSLGKASFKKVKERVRGKVLELAKELLRLEAARKSRKGYPFPSDTAWQEDFEAAFAYEETPDQIIAIEAVKKDMESPQPMDRLICGDVGYGKTEVAIRASFKAALAGRQVAFITPTTILALQHYQTFQKRFGDYPVSIDWVSRFRTSAEIRKIKNALQNHELDIVIGTHALLSGSFQIKNLGLLVVDEEQRFGVSHKEAMKRLRNLVDILTLTATPIPRTLHMSLVGIRELSVIGTPPQERLPIQTYVMEDRDSIIRDAILREKQRGGQVFFLHNRIQSIEVLANRIMQIVPEMHIAVLHGRMGNDEIEDTLLRFQDGHFDILVTTTIIENGIDIPNANTLIIDHADLFGLSQLYQIRGRVGRSDKQAYAYFLYPSGQTLTELAQKRLNTILEYQELGSGFKVAMRDLEIRGAGNVLGVEQSGHIAEVGYELYIKLLNEAVQKLRGEKIESEIRCHVQLNTDFYISEDYIVDVRQRIEFYKRFEAAKESDEVDALTQEMEDRFGSLPEVVKIFISMEHIRVLGQKAGFSSIQRKSKKEIEFRAGDQFVIRHENLLHCLQLYAALSVRSNQKDTLFYAVQKEGTIIQEVLTILYKLLGETNFEPAPAIVEKSV